MRAFVTGATGFIGRHLVEHLLGQGWEVTALARTMDRARLLPREAQIRRGHINDPASLRSGMRDADVVFHLAAWYFIGVAAGDRSRMRRVNVEGARTAIETALELGVPKIVYTSTVAVYGNTHGQCVDETYKRNDEAFASEYERTKYAAHYEVVAPMQARGWPIIVVCPGMVYGPGDTSRWAGVMRLYARKWLRVMLGRDNALTWAHIADIAAGHRLAAEKGVPGETYNLAGPAHTFREFFAACERATGIPAPRVWLPDRFAPALAAAAQNAAPGLAELLQHAAGISYLASADKAGRELGWTARSVEQGIPDMIDWLTRRGVK